jgi:hypothetical protein
MTCIKTIYIKEVFGWLNTKLLLTTIKGIDVWNCRTLQVSSRCQQHNNNNSFTSHDCIAKRYAVTENPQKFSTMRNFTNPTVVKMFLGTSKCYAPVVMVSIWERTLADKTVYQNRLFDTNFGPPLFSLDCTFKYRQ